MVKWIIKSIIDNKWFNRWIIELIMIIWSNTCKWIDDIVKEILNDPIII